MKWLYATVLLIMSHSVSAEILTEATLPKYDIQAECQNAPAAKFTPGWTTECIQIADAQRKGVIGIEVSRPILSFCDADTRLHGSGIYSYSELYFCIKREQALPVFAKVDSEVGTAWTFCDSFNRSDDKYRICLGEEVHYREMINRDPAFLESPAVETCIDDLRERRILAWSNIFYVPAPC